MCCGSNYELPDDLKEAKQAKINKIVEDRRKQVEEQTLIKK